MGRSNSSRPVQLQKTRPMVSGRNTVRPLLAYPDPCALSGLQGFLLIC